MKRIIRTEAKSQAFRELVQLLNNDLAGRDGASHPLSQFNPIDRIKYVVLAYENHKPIGCGAIAECELNTMEIKRMYVLPEARGRGIGVSILSELEKWAKELGSSKCILFTGKNQPEAIRLYERNGYKGIPKYGKLSKITDCLCFAKTLL